MNNRNNNSLEQIVPLTPEEQKAMVASGMTFSFGPKQSCTLTMNCAGVTISCSSANGDCMMGDYNSNLGMYLSIICDGHKYKCSDGIDSGTGGESDGSGTQNGCTERYLSEDCNKRYLL